MSTPTEQLQASDGQANDTDSGGEQGQRGASNAVVASPDGSESEGEDESDSEEDDSEEAEDDEEEQTQSDGTSSEEGDDGSSFDAFLVARAAAAAVATEMKASRWAFVAPFFLQWLAHSSCDIAQSPTSESNHFGSFVVYRPSGVIESTRTRHVIQLIAGMLHVDPEAWRFLRASDRAWFRSFDPTVYEPLTLVPKMTLLARHLLSTTGDDNIQAVRALHDMLLGPDPKKSSAIQDTKDRLQELQKQDTDKKLRDFVLPIGLVFSPEEPKTCKDLQLYVRSVLDLVEGLHERQPASSSEYPFRLEDITLTLYHLHLDAVQQDLNTLVSFGVPVEIRIRHLVRDFRDPFMCSQSGHVYAALAENPSPVSERAPLADVAVNKLEQSKIESSCELWSAVAFAPSLGDLSVFYKYFDDPVARLNQVKWLSFALRAGLLHSLVLDQFEPHLDDMAAFREVAESSDPVRLLASSSQVTSDTSEAGDGAQVVCLKTNAVIKIASGESKTQRELGIEKDWRLPVVCIHSEAKRIEFIVPGYAICSAPMSKVASITTVAPPTALQDRGDTGLRTLHVSNWHTQESGLAARFVEVYGQSLRRLRWDGDEYADFPIDPPFDEDLEVVLPSCPHLESIELQRRRLNSLQALVRHYESPSFRLRKLKLETAPVPPQELIRFFNHLANPRNRLAKTLESFEFEAFSDNYEKKFVHLDKPFRCVDVAVIDAALAMLRTNRTLSYFSLGIPGKLWKAHHRRFDTEKDVHVKTNKRLPLRERLAFLSVVQSQGSLLDSACASVIFDYFTHTTIRQIVIKNT